MAVRRIRSSWWVDLRHDHVRYRRRSPQNTRAGAEAYEVALRQRLAHGERLDAVATPTTFRAFAGDWLRTYVQTNNKASERYTKSYILERHLLPWFGTLPLDAVDTQAVERYKASKRADGYAAKTINNHLAVLSKCLGTAVDWGLAAQRPRVQLLRAKSERLDFLSPAEGAQLLADRDEPLWNAMVLLALRTGMRPGELAALGWEDVDLERGIIAVRRSAWRQVIDTPKTHRARYLPMTADVRAALSGNSDRRGLLFAGPDGSIITDGMRDKAMQRLCKRVGLRRVTWYTLRHTFASRLVVEGVPLPIVQQLMGHTSVTTTMRYAHLAPSALVQAVNVLEWAEQRAGSATFGQPAGNAPPWSAPAGVPTRSLNPPFPAQPTQNAPQSWRVQPGGERGI